LDWTAAAQRVLARCDALAAHSETDEHLTRTFLCEPMRAVHADLKGWMAAAGLAVRVDGVGNLVGRYGSAREDAPVLVIGSHVDTVRNAGRYDGVLGVLLGLAVLEALEGRRLPFAVELVGFSEEEGVRFSVPFIGSRGYLGALDDAVLALTDAEGVSVREAIRGFGLDYRPGSPPGEALGFLEVHIEQGPVLEQLGKPLGVVTAIQGGSRAEVTFTGRAGHAGTTPMGLRQDAFVAAAAWALDVEALARSALGLVATVGRVEVRPGAINVIPGEAVLSLDVRHADDAQRLQALAALRDKAEAVAAARGVGLAWTELLDQRAVPMDPGLQALLLEAAPEGTPSLPSGAGHDAMILAEAMPAAMLFVRSPGGLSHHPDEDVLEGDVAAALETLVRALELLAARRA
jgi:allantoate deiminase